VQLKFVLSELGWPPLIHLHLLPIGDFLYVVKQPLMQRPPLQPLLAELLMVHLLMLGQQEVMLFVLMPVLQRHLRKIGDLIQVVLLY
jgi:hypothetical protein